MDVLRQNRTGKKRKAVFILKQIEKTLLRRSFYLLFQYINLLFNNIILILWLQQEKVKPVEKPVEIAEVEEVKPRTRKVSKEKPAAEELKEEE